MANIESDSKIVGDIEMRYIRRSLEEQLLKSVQTFKAVLLTGPRQVGKSTLLKKLFPDRKYISLDDPFL